MEDDKKSKKRITINDIARISGYSKTSVSFAFNAPERISVSACKKIRAVAENLGYYPDPLARNFSLQRHRSIGFLLPQDIHYSLDNPYIMQIIQGVGSVCQKHGNTLTLIPPINESVTEAVRCAAVDGLITLGMSVEMSIVDIIKQRNLPFVTIDGIPSEEMPSVNVNDEGASYQIMKQVLDCGHTEIFIIGLLEVSYEKKTEVSIQHARLDGFSRALAEHNLSLDAPSITISSCECTLEEGRHMGHIISKMKKRPTCIISMSDIVAIGCILYLTEHGYVVPRDISVVGFDNIQESSYIVPSLTTVDQPGGEKGRHAAELLFSLIHGSTHNHIHITIPHRIVNRDSLIPLTIESKT